jgi:hypothetical protein
MKSRWNRTMLNLCDIVVAILKMVTGRNFSMSGIISGHHNLQMYPHMKWHWNRTIRAHVGERFGRRSRLVAAHFALY